MKFIFTLMLTAPVVAFAQLETDFSSGGAIRIGDSSTACSGATEGAIRFDADGADTIDYCNGTSWLTLLTSALAGDISNGGNTTGAAITIGTNDNFALNFETNNSTAMTIDTSGNVGIGTATPYTLLDIHQSGTDVANFGSNGFSYVNILTDKNNNQSGEDAAFRIYQNGVNTGAATLRGGFGYQDGTGLYLDVPGSGLSLLINSSSDIGIGTSSPENRLHIWDNVDLIAKFESANSSAEIIIEDPSSTNNGNKIGVLGDEMRFFTASAERLRIDNAGNVGIGTTTPDVELDVHTGTINAAQICDESNTNCKDISTGWGGGSGDISNGGNSTGATVVVGTNDSQNFEIESNGSSRVTFESGGDVKFGGSTFYGGQVTYQFASNPWDEAGDYAHINNDAHANSVTNTGTLTAMRNWLRSETSNNHNNIYGVHNLSTHFSSGTATRTAASYHEATQTGTGTSTDLVGVYSDVRSTGGTATNAYGFRSTMTNTATMTNGYGLYLEDVPATNDYGVYQAGSNDTNYFAGNVGIGTTSPTAKVHVVGEVRSIDSSGNNRLWGQGRPGTAYYGTSGVGSGLCTNGGTNFGLSYSAVNWEGTASACPQGTWVCTASERGTATCNTARPDHASNDGTDCSGSFVGYSSSNHQGWVADIGGYVNSGYTVTENGTTNNGLLPCNAQPVWCCSE